MKRIVEIVPARPGWYARWQVDPGGTRSYPVTLWALLEEIDGTGREVVGVDCVGQWPGADDNEAGGEFVRYLFQTPDSGTPEDAASPTVGELRESGPRLQATPAA
ncbi:hypothetical protein ACFFMM_26935 [Micromonospora chaiyaphumensis]|uniref:Uncharacterized protein n=2 Tax=Micromonospora TaxID=1873 RepID=A0AAJ2ZHR4_9ACTN|nr:MULTISPECIES: hypothetical protein [Micromonospora]NES30133.1 hypothetical protein [Micromonospora terminaliae]QGL46699.1 hypothetical protein GCE86_06325 [Micromonospora terminaliae]SCF16300.1 hypothetical protein GA0070214_107218 [Micromonospora chaiyaphumensis]